MCVCARAGCSFSFSRFVSIFGRMYHTHTLFNLNSTKNIVNTYSFGMDWTAANFFPTENTTAMQNEFFSQILLEVVTTATQTRLAMTFCEINWKTFQQLPVFYQLIGYKRGKCLVSIQIFANKEREWWEQRQKHQKPTTITAAARNAQCSYINE